MYPFGPGFFPPEQTRRIRINVPKQPALTRELSRIVTSTSTADSQTSSGGELISYIFPDFNAVNYFKKEFVLTDEFHLVEETVCSGFELYLVDQWIRSRKIGTVVSSFHGNYESKVKVIKFTILKKPTKQYPARFQEYLNEVMLNHATFKRRDIASEMGLEADSEPSDSTPEFLLVTNISALPSNLNLIPIPGGDTRLIMATYLINSNLRKLNCRGRSLSLIADQVTDASEDKFRQMYRVFSTSVPIKFAIKELVNLIQTCLFYFDLLDARYCDGLLCQKTEDAINNWWTLIGLPHFNTKPNPKAGILSAKAVASIISLTISVKIRLQIFGGCDVPKDPFDFENFMISIGQFQKQAKLEKRRKLDLATLLRLFYYTNQNLHTTHSKSSFGTFGNESFIEENELNLPYDPSANASFGLPKHLAPHQSTTSLANLSASAYKRNKIYYSNELKKLTNVVKNTVQDRIIVRPDNDNFYADTTSAKSNKLRSKIASKLSDSVAPADVETTDLDVLVRKYLVGYTLLRFWHGLQSGSNHPSSLAREDGKGMLSSTSRHLQFRHQNHQHHHNQHKHHSHGRGRNNEQNLDNDLDPRYQFVSLRDKITMTQDLPSILPSDKAGRLERVRIALQGRRPNSRMDLVSDEQQNNSLLKLGDSLLDNEIKRVPTNSVKSSNSGADISRPDIDHDQPKRVLFNRRNSFPFIKSGVEANFSSMGYCKGEDLHNVSSLHELKKCASFSSLEHYYRGVGELYSCEKMRIDYINLASKLIFMDDVKKKISDYESEHIGKTFKRINMELAKLQTMKKRMDSRKEMIDKDYTALLSGRMKDLTDKIDRMAFRSRDLLKKINELETNLKNFQFKLNQECNSKLDEIVDGLIHSTKFRKVFKDESERQSLILKLNGHDYRAESDAAAAASEKSLWGLRAVAVFLYEIVAFVLQVFNFDRSKMNLDRIRYQYGKLDPNRRYINKAYNFIGRDLVSMLRSGSIDSSRNRSTTETTVKMR